MTTTSHPAPPGFGHFDVPAASFAYLERAAASLREAVTSTDVPPDPNIIRGPTVASSLAPIISSKALDRSIIA